MGYTITAVFRDEDAELYDPDLVVLADSLGLYGVKDSEDAIIVAADEAMTRVSIGNYKYDVVPAGFTSPFTYSVKATTGGNSVFLTGTLSADQYEGRYTSEQKLRDRFGDEAIDEWSQLSANDDANARLSRTIEEIESEIDEFLLGGFYEVPFTAPVPTTVSSLATDLAAVRLYEARGLAGFDPEVPGQTHKLTYAKRRASVQLVSIKNGLLALSISANDFYPKVVCDDGSPDIS